MRGLPVGHDGLRAEDVPADAVPPQRRGELRSRATAAGREAVEGLEDAEVRGEVFAVAFFFAPPAGLLREDLLAELIGDPDPGEGAGP
ncbi:hypothetical protein WME94_43875 [Sorangium sp. So ce429]